MELSGGWKERVTEASGRGFECKQRVGMVEVMAMGIKNSIFRLKTSEVEHSSVMVWPWP